MRSRSERRRFEREWSKKKWPAWERLFMRLPKEERVSAIEQTLFHLECLTLSEAGLRYIAKLKCWRCEEIWVGPPGPGSGTCPACGHLYCTWLNAEEIIQAVKKERLNGETQQG